LNSRGMARRVSSRARIRAATARSDCSRCCRSARLGGRRLRRDDFDLLAVRKDEWEVSEEELEFVEDESAQLLRAQRVIARSKRVARAPKRPPARLVESEDTEENDFWEVADPWSDVWGLSPRKMSSGSTLEIMILGGESWRED